MARVESPMFSYLAGDRYTLCTSLGQLVKKDRWVMYDVYLRAIYSISCLHVLQFQLSYVRLHETLAKLKLSEEIRMKESLEEEKKVEEEIAQRKKEAEAEYAKVATVPALSGDKKGINAFLDSVFRRSRDSSDVSEPVGPRERSRRTKSISDSVALMRVLDSSFLHHSLQTAGKPLQVSEDDSTAQNTIANGFKAEESSPQSPGLRRMNTMVSHETPKLFEETLDLSHDRQARSERRRRIKCQSEGVATLRLAHKNDLPRLFLDSMILEGPEKLATLSELTKISAKVC